jgi:multisubunit Na+/H+ antiporter MnhF subunit
VSGLRALSPRAEKTIRLVISCALAAVLGIIAVITENEVIGYVAVAIVLLGILAGPVVARVLARPDEGKR